MKAALLSILYDRAITGIPFLGTPVEIVEQFTYDDQVHTEDLIKFYTGLGSVTGFVCGIPGLLMMPITLPANLMGVAMIQLHMSAAMAHIAGLDITKPLIREACIHCLFQAQATSKKRSEENELLNRLTIKLIERVVRKLIERTPGGFLLGSGGFRRAPIIGGLMAASTDAFTTYDVGTCARAKFLNVLPAATE